METERERNERHLEEQGGVWFAALLPHDEIFAKNNPQLKMLEELVPNKKMAIGWHVPKNWTVEDLPKFFTSWAIKQFGIFPLDFQI